MHKIRIVVWVLLIIAFVGLSVGVQAQSDDGLVAEWHFDEGSGSVLADSSGNGNDGVIYGATWVDGKYGKALSFDGTDDYVEVLPSSSLDAIRNSFTIEMWVNPDNVPSVGPRSWIAVFVFEKSDTDNGIWFYEGELNYDPARLKGGKIKSNEWQHISAVWNGSTITTYINSNQVASGSMKNWGDYNNVLIGIDYDREPYWFDGLIDEVRIYNRALAADEIKEHYELAGTTYRTSAATTSTPPVRIISAPSIIHGGEDIEVTVGWENIPTEWKLIVSLEKSDTDKDRLADDVERTISGSGEAVFKLKVHQIDKTYDYAKVWACLHDENDNWAHVFTETSITALPAVSPTPQIAVTPAPTPSVRIISAPSTIHGGEDIEVTVGWENIPANWKLILSLEKSDTDKDRLADDVEKTISGSGDAVFKLKVHQIDKTYDYAKVWACLRDENDNWASVLTETSITALPAASSTPQIASTLAPTSQITATLAPTSQITATPATTQKQEDGTTQVLILAGIAIFALFVIALIAGKLRGKTPGPITKDVSAKQIQPVSVVNTTKKPKDKGTINIKSAFQYKGATIQYKVKIINQTPEPLSDIKIQLFVPDVFMLTQKEKPIPMLEPGESKTVTFDIRPTGECGDCIVSGRMNYYDYGTKKRQDIDIKKKMISIVCPVLKRKEIDEDGWRNATEELIKAEENTKDLDIPAENLFNIATRVLKDMSMYMIPPEITSTSRLFTGMGMFYAEGAAGLRYAAYIEVVGGRKSRMILKAWAEKEEALTGFYHRILDEIEKRLDIKIFIDDGIIQYHVHKTEIKDNIIQRSNIDLGARAQCPECGREVEGDEKFCLECGAKL